MRLLKANDNGSFSLTEFFDEIPPYAILSHTWGSDQEELTFKDILKGRKKDTSGYRKIQFCGDQAAKDGLEYFWVDTCCIDKSSSAELAEAINSMFRWYQNSAKCYVFLTDVLVEESISTEDKLSGNALEQVRKSRWFTRGWTLQELVAPRTVEFFAKGGQFLGENESLSKVLYEITGIDPRCLGGRRAHLHSFSRTLRLSWARNRRTKREEDAAYSLLGIFGVHLAPIYGEGRRNSMRRLHIQIEEATQNFKYFMRQVQKGSRNIASILDQLILDLDTYNGEGETALYIAARSGYHWMVEDLLSYGANPKYAEVNGELPLEVALRTGHPGIACLLIQHGADVSIEFRKSMSIKILNQALHEWESDYVNILRVFIGRDSDDFIMDIGGRSLLSRAATLGWVETTRFLIDSGVDFQSQSYFGNTPMDDAILACQYEVQEVLLEKIIPRNAPDDKTTFFWAVYDGNKNVVQFYLDRGLDVESVDQWGETLLYWAISNQCRNVVRLLIQRGANPYRLDPRGRSPLWYAVYRRPGLWVMDRSGFFVNVHKFDRSMNWLIYNKLESEFKEIAQSENRGRPFSWIKLFGKVIQDPKRAVLSSG